MPQTHEGAMKTAAKLTGLPLDEYLARLAAGLKRCTKCKEWKSVDDFCKDSSRHDGKSARCFACSRVKERVCTKGRVSAFKGKKHTDEARLKMSKKRRGHPNPRKGIPRTLEERKKISQSLRASPKLARGSACHSYKDGKIAERRDQRHSQEYKRWRYDVFLRDKFTCQECGDARGGNLIAHHLKPFAEYPELRFEVSNGITLCRSCHDSHHYG